MTAAEEWRQIPGYSRYEASNLGRIRSLLRAEPYVLKAKVHPTGYTEVDIYTDDRISRRVRIHRIVLLTFVGPRPGGQVSRHLDGDKTNAALSNLAYGTPSENGLDTVRHGGHQFASRTQCLNGHVYAEGSFWVSKRNRRICSPCHTINQRRYRQKKAAA